MARPTKKVSEKKIQTKVWMLPDEYLRLKRRAGKAGLPYSMYCHRLLFSKKPVFYGGDYRKLISEINRIWYQL